MPTIYVLSKNKKNVTFFSSDNSSFTAVKNCSILHGSVIVMACKKQQLRGSMRVWIGGPKNH